MTKEEILNGMSEEEFYQLYPTKESWEQATQMKLGGLSGAPHNGQPTAAQFFNYGSHALDKFNIPFGHFAYGGGPIYPAKMGGPCYECGGAHMEDGGGLSRGEDYGSKKKPYPSVKSSDFAGGGRSYPIPTRADAVDALRLAGLHGRADVKAKVYAKYPDLKKAEYGFNSGVNYGSFSVPMQAGGDPTALWMAEQQMALMNKTKTQLPPGVKPTGTNPLNFNPFMKGSDIAQPDSMHTSPYNPNIAAYFKGNKVIAGPATDSGEAKRQALMLNRGKMYKKGDEIFTNYLHQDGGSLDPSNNQMYPILDFGGLNDIISAAAKHMKKAYGGDLTEQGGNQDFKKQYRATFDNYIKQNTYNAIVDAEQQAMMQELQQMPYAQGGKEVGHEGYMVPVPNGYYSNADLAKIKSMKSSNMICTAAGCFPATHAQHPTQQQANVEPTSVYRDNTGQRNMIAGQLADMYAPTKRSYNWNLGDYPRNMLNAYLPMNELTGYEFSKKDYDTLNQMGDQGQLSGVQMNYGPLGRMMPRVFGPKSITYGMIGPNSKGYFEDYKQPVGSPNAGTQSPEKSYDDMNWFQKKMADRRTNKMVGEEEARRKEIAAIGPEAYKENQAWDNMSFWEKRAAKKSMKENLHQDELRNKRIEEAQNATGLIANAYGGLFQAQDGKSTPISYDEWAARLKFKAPIVDDSEEMPPFMDEPAEQKPLDFSDVAGIQKNRQQQREMFGPPMNDQPDILRPDNVTAKKQIYWGDAAKYAPAAFNFLAQGLENRQNNKIRKQAELAMMTPGSDTGPFQSVPATGRRMGDYDPNSGMFRPNQMVPVQFQGNLYGYSQMGGALEEGEETELSPEEIAELRAQGYEIEELD